MWPNSQIFQVGITKTSKTELMGTGTKTLLGVELCHPPNPNPGPQNVTIWRWVFKERIKLKQVTGVGPDPV